MKIASNWVNNEIVHTGTINAISYTWTFSKNHDGTVSTKVTSSNYGTSRGQAEVLQRPTPCRAEYAPLMLDYEGDGVASVWLPKTLIEDESGIYIRTNIQANMEFEITTDPFYYRMEYVKDIAGFSYIESTNDMRPFDDKNYSKAIYSRPASATGQTFIVYGLTSFDEVTVAGVNADSVAVTFLNGDGSLNGGGTKDIDTKRDKDGKLPNYYTTATFYADSMVVETAEGLPFVAIYVYGTNAIPIVEIGSIKLGISVDAGMTNLQMTNRYKDFSTFEYDPFGNTEYIERAKVSIYNCTVDIPITDYDMNDRLMQSLGKSIVTMDGSDSANDSTDSQNIFAATIKLGRITTYDQKTKVKNNDIDPIAEYGFSFEEII